MVSRILERAKASGRIDDNAESVGKRLKSFRDGDKAVEAHLQEKGPFKTVIIRFNSDESLLLTLYPRFHVRNLLTRCMLYSSQRWRLY